VAFGDANALERAACLCEEGHFAEACNLLRPVAEVDPASVDAWLLLARAELAAGRFEQALESAEHVQALVPERVVPVLVASVSLFKLKEMDAAVERARDAARLSPEGCFALCWLARLLVATDSVAEAKFVAGQAVEVAPEAPEAHLTLGVVAAASGERETAKACFRTVLALDPANSSAQHELARLRLRRKFNDPASLAEAAAGFARAAQTSAESTRSQRSLEHVLTTFITKTAYLLFIDAWFVGRITAASTSSTARLLPLALLTIPGYYASRFLRRLTPVARQNLLWLLSNHRTLLASAAFEGLAVVCILLAALSSSAHGGLAAAAGLGAFAAYVLTHATFERTSRAVAGKPQGPAIRSALIWAIAGVLALFAIILVIAAATHHEPNAVIGAVILAAMAAALSRVAIRRRRVHI